MSNREIEHQAEQMQDDLDHRYLTTPMSDEEYSRRCRTIAEWERKASEQGEAHG